MQMATKFTGNAPQKVAYLHYWRKRGYQIKRGEQPSTDLASPPVKPWQHRYDKPLSLAVGVVLLGITWMVLQ